MLNHALLEKTNEIFTKNEKLSLSTFKFKNQLGSGSFGKVY